MKKRDLLKGLANGNPNAIKVFKEELNRPSVIPEELLTTEENELYNDLSSFHLYDTTLEEIVNDDTLDEIIKQWARQHKWHFDHYKKPAYDFDPERVECIRSIYNEYQKAFDLRNYKPVMKLVKSRAKEYAASINPAYKNLDCWQARRIDENYSIGKNYIY